MTLSSEIWIATALLHKENPRAADFSVAEIVDRALQEFPFRQGMQQHAYHHCVAQTMPNPPSSKHRFLSEGQRGRRRLFRPGDKFHSARAEGATVPHPEDLPERFRPLLDWYRDDFLNCSAAGGSNGHRGNPPTGSATEVLRKFAGCLTKEEAEEMRRIIEEEFEKVDAE